MLDILVYNLISLIILFSIFYIIAALQGIWNTVDIAYGGGFILISLVTLFLSAEPFQLRKLVVTGLFILWGLRIAYFLTIRKYGKDEVTNEDKRFKIFRDRWGKSAIWRGYILLYLPQVFFVLLIGFPVLVIITYGDPTISTLDGLGIILVFLAILLETLSDFQLNRFKSKPENKGKIFTDGLWKYSQHPNYFFEMTVWWGFWIVSIFSVPFEHILWAILSIIGPILISASLLKVSGIPLLKRRFEESSDYSEYQKRTSILIPWFPKKK